MATVINNPSTTDRGGNGFGYVVAAIIFLITVFLLIFYGIPNLKGMVNTPSTPQIKVPDKVDVNVHQNK